MACCLPGRFAKMEVSPDNGLTWVNVGGIVDVSVNGTVDSLECTTHDSGGARSFVPNFHTETMDLSTRWCEEDPGLVVILSAIFPEPTTFKVRFYMQQLTGKYRFDAEGFVTSFTASGPLDDTASFDMTMQLSNTTLAIQL